MKKLTAFTAALMMSASVAVAADQMHPQRGEPMPNSRHEKGMKQNNKAHLPLGMAELNLTEAQKNQIKAIMEADRTQREQKHNGDKMAKMQQKIQKMQTYRNQERALMNNKNFDETAARRMIAERNQQFAQERAEMEKNRAERELQMLKKRHAVFQVLTPEQQKQYQENQQKKMDEMQKRHENRFQINQ